MAGEPDDNPRAHPSHAEPSSARAPRHGRHASPATGVATRQDPSPSDDPSGRFRIPTSGANHLPTTGSGRVPSRHGRDEDAPPRTSRSGEFRTPPRDAPPADPPRYRIEQVLGDNAPPTRHDAPSTRHGGRPPGGPRPTPPGRSGRPPAGAPDRFDRPDRRDPAFRRNQAPGPRPGAVWPTVPRLPTPGSSPAPGTPAHDAPAQDAPAPAGRPTQASPSPSGPSPVDPAPATRAGTTALVPATTAPAPAPAPSPTTHPRGRARLALAGRITSGVLAAVVLAATGIAWGTKEWANNQVRDVDALDPNSAAIVDKAKQAGDENFLLVGSDSRAGAQPGDNIGNTNLVPGARSDSVMVVHLPADRSRMVIVSFPRDLEVNRAACQGWDSATGKLTEAQAPADPVSKLNEAYAVGGPKCTLKVIQQISGLKINHFMGVDFQGFKAMVDAMQGVSVCVEHPIIDAELGVVVPKAGTVQLAGDQALNFVRARHVAGDPTSDYGRIRRQQRFISALMRKAASGSVLLDPGKLKAFVTAMAGSTFTDNLDIDQMLMLGQSMQNLDTGRVTFVTLPTTGIANARGNEVLRADQAKALFTAVINGTPLPGEAPAPAGAPATPTGPAPQPSAPGVPMPFAGGPITVAPQDIKLQVVNAAGKDGLANRLTTALQGDGFTVVKQGSTAPSPTSVIRYSTGHEAEAATVAAAVPSAQLLADQSMGGALELTVGTDYNGVVLPVRAGTTAPPSGVQRSGLAAPAGPPAGALPQGLQTINAADARCS